MTIPLLFFELLQNGCKYQNDIWHEHKEFISRKFLIGIEIYIYTKFVNQFLPPQLNKDVFINMSRCSEEVKCKSSRGDFKQSIVTLIFQNESIIAR